MKHEVVFAPEAQDDLISIYDFIAARSYPDRAYEFVTNIQEYCEQLADFPEIGQRRDDLRAGLRVINFRRRVTIVFHIAPARVIIDRVLYGGRDLDGIWERG